ncbi:LLM class flavin-dependent oxidoreductase [Micromonospora sp. NPDC005367]|uniref:LLM class flavin-dependent oxidoreductase n=1 Tax=Micromonospora sp. NPDC005367 TaxID=3155590 RepID=UPI0033A5B6CA
MVEYAKLQHLADGRIDLMMGRGNTGPVYPRFGQDIRNGIPLAVENYALLRRLWREDVVDWHASIRSPEIAEQAAYHCDGFFHNNLFWPKEHVRCLPGLYRRTGTARRWRTRWRRPRFWSGAHNR